MDDSLRHFLDINGVSVLVNMSRVIHITFNHHSMQLGWTATLVLEGLYYSPSIQSVVSPSVVLRDDTPDLLHKRINTGDPWHGE